MGFLDVDSLFTSIPLDWTIEISTNELFKESETVERLNKSEFKELLYLATKDSHFSFARTLFKQIDDVAMVSPWALIWLMPFLDCHEKNYLKRCQI